MGVITLHNYRIPIGDRKKLVKAARASSTGYISHDCLRMYVHFMLLHLERKMYITRFMGKEIRKIIQDERTRCKRRSYLNHYLGRYQQQSWAYRTGRLT